MYYDNFGAISVHMWSSAFNKSFEKLFVLKLGGKAIKKKNKQTHSICCPLQLDFALKNIEIRLSYLCAYYEPNHLA